MSRPLFNQQQQFVRVFLLLAAGLLGFGCVAVVVGTLVTGVKNADGSTADARIAGEITGAIAFIGAVVILICAAVSWPAARRARTILNEMTSGKALAHFEYPDAFWRAWVERDTRGRRWIAWLIAGFVFVVGGVCIYAMLTPTDPQRPIPYFAAGVFALVSLILIVMTFALFGSYRRRRRNRLLLHAECYILPTAVYIGGDVAFWNVQMRALRQIDLVEADPPYLQLTLGMSRGAAGVTRGVGIATLAAGGAGYAGDMINFTRIPLLPEQVETAKQLIPILAAEAGL